MALNGLNCAAVPLRTYSLTHSLLPTHSAAVICQFIYTHSYLLMVTYFNPDVVTSSEQGCH